MSETEALMWAVEQDPNLGSTMGSVMLLEAAPEPERVVAAVTSAVAAVPRLRQRVVPSVGPVGSPAWAPDRSFDLEHHLRHVRVPAPGRLDQLRQLAAQFVADPFDRTRPLWQILLVTGLRGGKAALLAKLHHSVTDGTGALLVAQHLLELEADSPPPEPVDLDEVLEADELAELGPERTANAMSDQLRKGAELALRLVEQAATTLADPAALQHLSAQAVTTARALAAQLPGNERHTSPLWATRSRNRRLEWLNLPLPPARDRAHELGISLNDLFVAATTEGAVAYHARFGVELAELTATVIVSTRSGADGEVANAFTPTAAVLPAGPDVGPDDRARAVSAVLAAQKDAARSTQEAVGPIAGLLSLLPASLATGVALDQAHRVDFATSNLRGMPVPVWVGGRRITALYPIGPVVGTAFNITLMSNLDELHLGLNIDPAAVSDPPLLARSVADGFRALGVGARTGR
jgi:diacylglycerol O-acyltransferase / wax synthase